jgi:hypothetical protein
VELLLRTTVRILVSPVMHVGHEWYGGVEARVLSSPDSDNQSAFAQALAFFQFTIDGNSGHSHRILPLHLPS